MAIQGADIVAIVTLGVIEDYTATAEVTVPNAPQLNVSVSGTTANISVTGDEGMLHQVWYQRIGDIIWVDGGQRIGDGDLAPITGLSPGSQYVFVAQSFNGTVPSSISTPFYKFIASTDLLKTGMQLLEGLRKTHMTTEVRYVREADSVVVVATKGKTDFTAFDDGTEVGSEITDFLITAADLILNGQLITPEHGDQIITDIGTYEVMHLSGDGCWRYSDSYGKTLRIHTKLVQ